MARKKGGAGRRNNGGRGRGGRAGRGRGGRGNRGGGGRGTRSTVSSLPLPFRRAKEALRLAHVDQRRDFPAAEMTWAAMDATDIHEKLRLAQGALEFYPFCAEAWGIVGRHYREEEKNFEVSIEAYQTGVEAARRVRPELSPDNEQTHRITWATYEYRPYIRNIMGLAQAYFDSGQIDAAMETAEQLQTRGCGVLDLELSGWYIRAARWEDARRVIERSDLQECGVAYNDLLIRFHFYEAGGRSDESYEDLCKAMGHALEANIHVPNLLALDGAGHRTRPEHFSPGGEDEAMMYAMDFSCLWKAENFGALEWLMSAREKYGPKPNEEVFVQWLRKRLVYVEFSNRPAVQVTQDIDKMIGTGLPDFQMRPECFQPHTNGSVICAQEHVFEHGRDNWIEFRYEEVSSVPFWSVLLPKYEAEEQGVEPRERDRNPFSIFEPEEQEEECKQREHDRNRKREERDQHKTKMPPDQRMDKVWSKLNAQVVSMIASFLTLKEKAAVRSLGKAWKEGSTLGTEVEIDPEHLGLNLNGALRFVATSFPRLQHFTLQIDQGYFLNNNDELWNAETEMMGTLQLNGESLRSIFHQESIRLRSATIAFGSCVEEHTSRILVEEQGLSAVHRQVSLRELSFSNAYFESLRALSFMIRPLVNLQRLRLAYPTFPQSEYRFGDPLYDLWQDPSELMSAIGSLPNLRALSIDDHRLSDNDLRHLSTLAELRELMLNGPFGHGFDSSLTDRSMVFIASSFPKLESLDVSYNRSITMKGVRKVIRSCPLRELEASEILRPQSLEEIISVRPSLRFIRYGVGYAEPDETFLRRASVASQGRCVFLGQLSLYEPRFDSTLLANHKATKKLLEDEERNSNNYDD